MNKKEFLISNSCVQTFEEATFPLRPYTLMVYFLDGTNGPYKEEIVSNINTGEKLSIRKEKSFRTGDYTSIEIKRGA